MKIYEIYSKIYSIHIFNNNNIMILYERHSIVFIYRFEINYYITKLAIISAFKKGEWKI